MRVERDYIGEMELPDDALFGMNAKRAAIAFPNNKGFNVNWYKTLGLVKKAVYLAYRKFITKVQESYELEQFLFSKIQDEIISEFIISICHQIYANDNIVSSLSAQGCLELNAYLPIIGDAILNSLENLIACNKTLKENLLTGLTIDNVVSERELLRSPAITTVLIPYVGYDKAQKLAIFIQQNDCDIYEANRENPVISEEMLQKLLSPSELLRVGFSVKDILEAKDGI